MGSIKAVERINVLFEVEAPVDPRKIVLDGGGRGSDHFDVTFAKFFDLLLMTF